MYSPIAFLLSDSEYSMKTVQSEFDFYFDFNGFSDDIFSPSFLPKWLLDTSDYDLIPAPNKKFIDPVLNLVWPVLKSFPT
jgi:hypothetical protein